MDTITVPTSLIKRLLKNETRRFPGKQIENLTDSEFEDWAKGLETWQETWTAMSSQADQARTLLLDPEIWTSALSTLQPWSYDSHKSKWKRCGDWKDIACNSSFENLLPSIKTRWLKAGFESVSQASSSTEWMALSIMDLEEKLNIEISQTQWEDRVREAFFRDSAALMSRLLTSHPHWSIEKVFTEQLSKKSHTSEPSKPLAHLLFSAHHCEASLALARLRPESMALLTNAVDHKGQTPLFSYYHDLLRAEFLLMYGANPMARDHQSRLPEEAQSQNTGNETAAAFHQLLNKNRSNEDQKTAHKQWLAAMATGCSVSLLKSLGLFQEVAELDQVDVKGRKASLLAYFLEFNDNRSGAKETITLLATLAKSIKGEKFLAKSGSIDEGLAHLLTICLKKPSDKLSERMALLLENLARTLTQVKSDQKRTGEVVHRTFELMQSSLPSQMHGLMGKHGIIAIEDPSSIDWDITRLGSVAQGILDAARYLNPKQEAREVAKWETVSLYVEHWTSVIEEQSLKTQWLPAVAVAALMCPSNHRKDVLVNRLVSWLSEGIKFSPEDPKGKSAMDLVQEYMPDVSAKVRELQLNNTLPEPSLPERLKTRM